MPQAPPIGGATERSGGFGEFNQLCRSQQLTWVGICQHGKVDNPGSAFVA